MFQWNSEPFLKGYPIIFPKVNKKGELRNSLRIGTPSKVCLPDPAGRCHHAVQWQRQEDGIVCFVLYSMDLLNGIPLNCLVPITLYYNIPG